MPLIRPEVRAAAWRGRECLTGLGIMVLGLWAAWDSFGLLMWLGYGAVIIGAMLALAGWQRMRLRPQTEGRGLIEVDEGRVTYWGPLDGGAVERDTLRSVVLDHRQFPATWTLSDSTGTILHIPVNAGGQDALLDAFSALPGLSTQAILTAIEAKDGQRHLLWSGAASVDTTVQT